jgi:hypothetical protein
MSFFFLFFLFLAFCSRAKYLRSSVNKKLWPDRSGGNDDGKRERGKKERNSVLRDDRRRWRVAYPVSRLVATPLSFTLLACSLTVAVLHTRSQYRYSHAVAILSLRKRKRRNLFVYIFFFNIFTLRVLDITCYNKF